MPINHTPLDKNSRENSKVDKEEKKEIIFTLSIPKYTFNDIVLSTEISEEIRSIIALDKYKDLIYEEWGLSAVIKGNKNISINLYGYSGTGKTMTAHAIASELDKKLLLVNYSEIESKYVGETSKNLVSLFSFAQYNDAIIVFDEADALLSKRVTAMHTAADVSVNQTRNVLLKILDDYQGIVIFTTNFIQNFDHAFMRRIMSHIKFEMPDEKMRQKLWTHYLVDGLPLSCRKTELVDKLAVIDRVTGADISTAVLKAAIKAATDKRKLISIDNLSSEINKIVAAKAVMKSDDLTVTSRRVSQEYVREKLGVGGIIDGNN